MFYSMIYSRRDTAFLLSGALLVAALSSRDAEAASLSCTPDPDPNVEVAQQDATPPTRPSLSLPFATKQPIDGSSDSMVVSEQHLNMAGNVYLRQQEWQAWADKLEHQFKTATTRLSGNVRFDSEALKLKGESAVIEQDTNAYSVSSPSYKFSQEQTTVFRGEAETARFENKIVTASKGWVTTCPPGDNSWSIRARTVRLDEARNRGTARDLVFRLGKLPVFYLPWFQFPTTKDRQSGMLIPDLQLQGNGDPDLALPIYINLAPNYDAIITPRIIFGRGLLAKLDLRHLTKAMQNEAQASLMPNDRDATFNIGGSDKRPNRWHVGWQHQGYWPGGLNTRVDYTQTSDRFYYRDFGNDREVITQGELRQAAILGLQRRDWSATLLTQRFQILDVGVSTPYTLLPALDFHWQPVRGGRLKWELQAGLDRFDRNALTDREAQQVTGERLRATPRLVYQVGRRYGGVRVDGAWRYRRFDIQEDGEKVRRELNSGLLSLDAHLKMVRYSQGERQYAHFLEPRIFYLWSQYQDQSELPLFDTTTRPGKIRDLFIENRFTGADRVLDANRIVLSVANRWQDLTTGHQWASLGVASLIRLAPERVSLSGTPSSTANDTLATLLVELNVRPTKNITLGGSWTYNPTAEKTTKLILTFGYRGGERKIINLQYRDRQQRRRLRGSLYWPLGENFQFAAAWNRDTKTDSNLERMFGIEYFHCCWRFRLGWRAFPVGLDSAGRSVIDKGVFFHFSFRGLGRIRSSAAEVYRSSIQGFHEPDIWDTE